MFKFSMCVWVAVFLERSTMKGLELLRFGHLAAVRALDVENNVVLKCPFSTPPAIARGA